MASQVETHEPLARPHPVRAGSERGFGLVFTAVFIVVALWPLTDDGAIRLWAVAVAAVFLAASLLMPPALRPLNLLWAQFGELLSRIVSPVVLGLIFYVSVAPVGLLMRCLGKDPLKLRLERGMSSYWIPREPPGPPPQSLKNQY